MLTVSDVKRCVEDIAAIKHDDEMAHSLEDMLYEDVLKAIAAGECEDPQECAKIALMTAEIDFARWCA